ncbi:MAG TPA: pyridoxal-phosphate dependent enzyme [Pirellulaceae bacterium]|nr:pyridoxal-phosphate dependent enzyme [Pirellulaceae bacterium]
MSPFSFANILAAKDRIASGVLVTPCPFSPALSERYGCEIYCKLEFLHRTGSFKERGARNALLQLDESRRKQGVIAASAGNHALALAAHGSQLGIPVTVVMPTYAPLVKQANCRRLGATVLLHGASFGEAKAKADELAAAQQLTYIHGYDDLAIIAGQGTIGLEVAEQVPNLDAIIVPIGGGGLIAGVATAVKNLKPNVQVVGVEPANSTCYTSALAAGKPVRVQSQPTLADGLAVGIVGENAFAIARDLVDHVVTVSEYDLALAVVRLMELEKTVVEGAGAAPLAALLSSRHTPCAVDPQGASGSGEPPARGGRGGSSGQVENLSYDLAGKRVVLVLAGGNIDLTILSRLIETALVADGRLVRFTAVISDRPGGLARLTSVIAEAGASVKEITHDRTFSGPNVAAVNVLCTVETRDQEHIAALYQKLTAAGIRHFAHVGAKE